MLDFVVLAGLGGGLAWGAILAARGWTAMPRTSWTSFVIAAGVGWGF